MNLHLFLDWFRVLVPGFDFSFTYHILNDVCVRTRIEIKQEKTMKILCSLCCLQWNKNKYRDHKYQHSVLKYLWRCVLKRWTNETAPPRHSIGSIRVFIGLCIRTNKHTRVCVILCVCVCVHWCTHGWASNTRLCFISVTKHSIDFSRSHSPFTLYVVRLLRFVCTIS